MKVKEVRGLRTNIEKLIHLVLIWFKIFLFLRILN